MASNSKLLLIVLLVLFSLSVASGYSLSPRDAVSKQEDETYVMTASDHGSLMINVDDLPKSRNLQALVNVSKAVSKNTSKKSKKKDKKTKKKKSKKNGGLEVGALVGIIIAVVLVTIIILCILYCLYDRHKTKKAQIPEQEKVKVSSETKTSKADDHV